MWPLCPPSLSDFDYEKGELECQVRLQLILLVSALNFMACRERATPLTAAIRAGRERRSSGSCWSMPQLRALIFLEGVALWWITQPAADMSAFGRTSAKMEGHEKVVKKNEMKCQDLIASADSYVHNARRLGQQLKKPRRTAAQKTQHDRLRFQGSPRFDPIPFIDEETRSIYIDPACVRLGPEEAPAPPICHHRQSWSETLLIYRILDSHGLLRLIKASESDPAYRGALGGVRKDDEIDRLILIRMPENSREEAPATHAKRMASGTLLCSVHLEEGEALAYSADDLRYFYHCVAVSDERALTNALRGE